jgi:hypothetical protein
VAPTGTSTKLEATGPGEQTTAVIGDARHLERAGEGRRSPSQAPEGAWTSNRGGACRSAAPRGRQRGGEMSARQPYRCDAANWIAQPKISVYAAFRDVMGV